MRYGVVPTKIFLHENFSNENFIARKFLDLRYANLKLEEHRIFIWVDYFSMRTVLVLFPWQLNDITPGMH